MPSPSKSLSDYVNKRASNMSAFKEMKTPREQISMACGIISLCGVVRPNIFATTYAKHDVYVGPVDMVSFGTTPKGKFSKFVFPHDRKDLMYLEISQPKWDNISHMNALMEGIAAHSIVAKDGIKYNSFQYVMVLKGNRMEFLNTLARMYLQLR